MPAVQESWEQGLECLIALLCSTFCHLPACTATKGTAIPSPLCAQVHTESVVSQLSWYFGEGNPLGSLHNGGGAESSPAHCSFCIWRMRRHHQSCFEFNPAASGDESLSHSLYMYIMWKTNILYWGHWLVDWRELDWSYLCRRRRLDEVFTLSVH